MQLVDVRYPNQWEAGGDVRRLGHFGDREPSEEEMLAVLRDRLIAEGRTPEEADRFLATWAGPP